MIFFIVKETFSFQENDNFTLVVYTGEEGEIDNYSLPNREEFAEEYLPAANSIVDDSSIDEKVGGLYFFINLC